MIGQNIHTTIVSSTYDLLKETDSALLRLCDQASSLVLIVNSTEQSILPSHLSEEITLLELSEELCVHLLRYRVVIDPVRHQISSLKC